jgi:hypothetical protein
MVHIKNDDIVVAAERTLEIFNKTFPEEANGPEGTNTAIKSEENSNNNSNG